MAIQRARVTLAKNWCVDLTLPHRPAAVGTYIIPRQVYDGKSTAVMREAEVNSRVPMNRR